MSPTGRRARWVVAGLLVTVGAGGCVSVTTTAISSFTSESGHFSVTVPNGKMDEQTAQGTGHWAGATVETYVNTQANGTRFALVTVESTDGFPQPGEIVSALDDLEASNVSNTGGSQTSDRPLQIAGLSGREQEITSPSATYVFRMAIQGTRFWLWSVKGTTVTAHEAMSTVFLDSFQALP